MRIVAALLLCSIGVCPPGHAEKHNSEAPQTNPPFYIAFLWHIHQPIYWPHETVVQTDENARHSYATVKLDEGSGTGSATL